MVEEESVDLSRSLSFERTFEKNAAYWMLMPGSITMPSQCFDIFTVILKSAMIFVFSYNCIRRSQKKKGGTARFIFIYPVRFWKTPWSQNKVKTVHAPI